MKPEQQRIAIAEACGWIKCGCNTSCVMYGPPGSKNPKVDGLFLPDYLKDRNAMHEAIVTRFTTPIAQHEFEYQLRTLLAGNEPSYMVKGFKLATAPCGLLVEAFLKASAKFLD